MTYFWIRFSYISQYAKVPNCSRKTSDMFFKIFGYYLNFGNCWLSIFCSHEWTTLIYPNRTKPFCSDVSQSCFWLSGLLGTPASTKILPIMYCLLFWLSILLSVSQTSILCRPYTGTMYNYMVSKSNVSQYCSHQNILKIPPIFWVYPFLGGLSLLETALARNGKRKVLILGYTLLLNQNEIINFVHWLRFGLEPTRT